MPQTPLRPISGTPVARAPRNERQTAAEILRYQRRLGRVRRVGRGVYVVVPESMHPSMRSRARTTLRRLAAERDDALGPSSS